MADNAERLIIDLEARVTQFEKAFQRASKTANDNWKSIEARGQQAASKLDAGFAKSMKPRSIKLDVPTREISTLQSALDHLHVPEGLNFEHLKGSIGGLAAGLGLNEVRKFADEWTNAGNRIVSATQDAGKLPATLEAVSMIAERSRGSLEQAAQVYASLTRASKEFGGTQAQTAIATETVIKALTMSGSNTSQIEGALSDLAQGLQRGVLQGQELKALLGEVPAIADAIAKEFGVSVGEVKELGTEGKLTSDRVFKALVSAAGDVNKAFANTKPTIEQSFAVLETAATRFVGQNAMMQTATGATAAALQGLGNHFNTLASGAGALGLILATRLVANGLTPIATSMLAGARATASAAAAQIEFSSIVGTSIIRLGAASIAARGLSAALSLVGGPVGAALLGATAAATYFAARAQEAEERSKSYAQALTDLKAKADAAASGVKGVGDAVAETSAKMNAVEINRLNQQLKEAEHDAADAAEALRQFAVFVENVKPPAGADQLKGFFALVEQALHGDAQAALAAQNAIADLANSNPDFQDLADGFNPLLEKLAGIRASIAATKAAISGLNAPAPASTGPNPFGALDVPGIKAQMGADYLKNRLDDAKNSDATRARQKMAEMLGAAGGTVTPEQAYKAGLKEIAIEDAPSGKRRGGGGAHHKSDADQDADQDAADEKKVTDQIAELQKQAREQQAVAAATNGLTEGTLAYNTAKQAAIELAKNNVEASSADGQQITSLTAKIEAQKDALEKADEAKKKLAEAGEFMKDGFADALDSIIVKGESAQQVFANLAKTLESALLKSLLTGGGSFGGLFGGTSGGLFGGIGKMLGFADGGQITGPGTGTSDSILARVSAGEFVVNAKATKSNLGLLHALNNGKLPGFATGGLVGSSSTASPTLGGSGGVAGANLNFSHKIEVNGGGGTSEQNQDLAKQISAQIERATRDQVGRELRAQMRPGGALNR